MSATLVRHVMGFTNEARDLPPVDGWAMRESTGNMTVSCDCGVTVCGPVDQAKPLAYQHLRDNLAEADWPQWLRPA